jgi:hypothetical protein
MAVLCVEKHSTNIECMHVKCKFVVIVVWNNFEGIKFMSTNVLLKNLMKTNVIPDILS